MANKNGTCSARDREKAINHLEAEVTRSAEAIEQVKEGRVNSGQKERRGWSVEWVEPGQAKGVEPGQAESTEDISHRVSHLLKGPRTSRHTSAERRAPGLSSHPGARRGGAIDSLGSLSFAWSGRLTSATHLSEHVIGRAHSQVGPRAAHSETGCTGRRQVAK